MRYFFLYEGYTEIEFYDKLFTEIKLDGNLPIKKKNLGGTFNLNSKVADRIDAYLQNPKHSHVKYLTVVVAYDRECLREEQAVLLNAELVKNKINDRRLKVIHEIIATQMVESWFFIDLDGIYEFLKAPEQKRKPHKYQNHEKFRHEDLHQLFQGIDKYKRYHKGVKCEDLVKHLDVIKIYHQCEDLKIGINKLLTMAGISHPKQKSK